MGGGGVGLISCDLGCINGVDSSLHFILFFESFVLILGIFFKVVLGVSGSWWIVVGDGGLYLWVVVASCAYVWWWVWVVFFFFFFGCGFHVIVGGGGVGLILCDLGCINGVNSSLHFLFFS